jgi:hypothetical protein
LLSVLWSPFLEGPGRDVSLRWHAPVGVLSVVVALLFVGAIEPRFFAPVLPVVALVFWRVIRHLTEAPLPDELARLFRHAAVIVTCAWGVWPGHALVHIAQNIAYERPFSSTFLVRAQAGLKRDEPISLPATTGLVSKGGHDVMYWLRRAAAFPAATTDGTGTPLADPDEAHAFCQLMAAQAPGSAMVIPRRACVQESACRGMDLIASDREWLLGRRNTVPVTCARG